MTQHRSEQSAFSEASRRLRDRFSAPVGNDVTDIIPIDDFLEGLEALAELEFLSANVDAVLEEAGPEDARPDDVGVEDPDATAVLEAPELDDLHSAEDPSPLELTFGADQQPRRGAHRKATAGPVRGRILIGAMAVGAVAAAAHSTTGNADETTSQQPMLVAEQAPLAHPAEAPAPRGMQVITVKPAATFAVHDEEFAKGVAYAQERAEREARLQRPLFVAPTTGIFTSSFGYRWGSLHAGIDIANSIGTPIVAASDGVVIEAGPAAGYGALVKVRHSDGTVTLYGHVNTWTVSVGDRVMAGDQIATMGNRGFSTGPHCHFEVLLNGTSRVDPLPWLAQRGINIGNFAG